MTGCHISVRVLRSGEKRYVVRYRLGGRGFKIRHAGSFRSLREARVRQDLVRGWLASGQNPAVELAAANAAPAETRPLTTWAREYEASRVDVADATRRNLRTNLNRIEAFFADRWPTVDVADVQEWVSELTDDGILASSIGRYVQTLRQLLDYAGADPNPARDRRLRLPRVETAEKRIPSARDIETMIAHAPARRRLPLRMLAATGARVGELGAWEWRDVDLDRSRILNRSGKTRVARRWVTVPPELLDELIASCPPDDRTPERRLFPGFTPMVAWNTIARACTAAGIAHMSPHDLRHRYVSVQLARGVPVADVAAQVGHAKTSLTLDVYTHVVLDEAGER